MLEADTEAFSRLIGLIYDCALDPGRWRAALSALREMLGFANAALTLQELPSGAMRLNVTSGVPADYASRMLEYGADLVDQWGGEAVLAALPFDEPAVLSKVNPAGHAPDTTNRYTLEWARPQGLVDVMGLGLARDAGAIASIGLGRHENSGPIGGREVNLGRLLIPHLQRALAISRLLDVEAIGQATLAAALDCLALPTLLVDRELRLIQSYRAGQALLRDQNPLRQRGDDVLVAAVPAVTHALAVAVAQASNDVAALGQKGAAIPTWRADGTAMALHVLPLAPSPARPTTVPGCVAAVFVSTPADTAQSLEEIVAALFDLTATEARVFAMLARGVGRAEAAQALGVALSTVKTHMLRLYAKLGVRRQSDIVSLAASLSMPLAS